MNQTHANPSLNISLIKNLEENLLKSLQDTFSSTSKIPDDILESLNSIYKGPLIEALTLIDKYQEKQPFVTKLCLLSDNSRELYQVIGSTGNYYYLFSALNFCTCPMFKHNVLLKFEFLYCKHIICVKICLALKRVNLKQIGDQEYADIMDSTSELLDEIPTDIDITKFASYRAHEIELLKSDAHLVKEEKNKSLFQMLPRHMRRRTMGYIRKRLPRRIRHLAVIKAPNKVSKRPSRKYRRRPSNLLSEYERRKRVNQMWLETHIWHAKRFHMDRLYGYKLALHDNCKAMRPTIKALNKFCLLHDESYYICWQLEANESYLTNHLSRICSSDDGLTFKSKMYLNGQYEGSCVIYEIDKYPLSAIGPVRFLWKTTLSDENSSTRLLWIWIHPCIYDQIKELFIKLFELDVSNVGNSPTGEPESKKAKLESDQKTHSSIEPLKSIYFENEKIKLKCLKDNLVRFKLLGPYSTSILANTLKPVDLNEFTSEWSNNTLLIEQLSASDSLKKLKTQIEMWNKIKQIPSPTDITPSLVIGLLVRDPRLILPKKKSFKTTQEENIRNSLFNLNMSTRKELREAILSHSQIWNQEIIQKLNGTKMSTFEINKMRSKHLIPENEISLGPLESKIPLLLIQNGSINSLKSNKNGCMLSGWDVVLPQAWAMSFWQTLVYYGARAIGQQELKYAYYESGNLYFPDEYIDTKAGKCEQNDIKTKSLKKYQAKPPSKRVNYIRNGFFSPFSCPSNIVGVTNGFVLRNKQFLRDLSHIFFGKSFNIEQINKLKAKFDNFETIVNQSFIMVRIESVEKGSLDSYSQLYALNSNDLSLKKYSDITSINQENNIKQALTAYCQNKNVLIEDCLINEEKLEKFQPYLNNCLQRRLIGVITNGKFSSTNGQPSANAYILTKDILKLAENQHKSKLFQNLILYRTSNSSYLKLAKINEFFI